jgi:hypothetical protein
MLNWGYVLVLVLGKQGSGCFFNFLRIDVYTDGFYVGLHEAFSKSVNKLVLTFFPFIVLF